MNETPALSVRNRYFHFLAGVIWLEMYQIEGRSTHRKESRMVSVWLIPAVPSSVNLTRQCIFYFMLCYTRPRP